MRFGPLQRLHFGADDGAFSIVTVTEATDPQITLDQDERAVVLSVIPEARIHRGSRKSGGSAAMQTFRRWPDGLRISQPLVFPKPDKDEMRLYIPKRSDFAPPAGAVWFIFRRGRQLWIGALSEGEWRSIGRADPDDEVYEASIYEPERFAATPSLITSLRYPRSRNLALAAMKRAGFRCEVDPRLPLFTARSTGRGYLEPHHLIPMSLQPSFRTNLDHFDNIYCLSPHH